MGNPTNRASGGMGLLRPEVLVKAGKSESPPLIRPVAGTCLAEKGPRAPPPPPAWPAIRASWAWNICEIEREKKAFYRSKVKCNVS